MATKGLETLYNWAKSTGYERSIDDFYNLLSTNKDAFARVYGHAKETGYQSDENAFANLIGLQPPPVEPIRRSEEGAAPTAIQGEAGEEQPMSAAPETPVAETEKPMSEAKATALETDLNNKLLPVTENTAIKEVPAESDKMVIKSPEKKKDFLEAADEVLYRIYNSPGYLKKLENEIAQSKDFNKDYDPKVLEELNVKGEDIVKKIRSLSPESNERNTLMKELSNVNQAKGDIYKKISLIGGKYNTTELANERRKRVETTKVKLDEENYDDSAGFMRRSYTNKTPWDVESNRGMVNMTDEEIKKKADENEKKGEEFTKKEQPLTTDIYLFPETIKSDTYKTNEYSPEDYRSDLMATAIEEKEHSSHVPFINPGGLGRNIAENITPYAVDVIKENAIIEDDYLTDPTEVIAKKRATEVNLIGRGLLNPGENVDESHFIELLKSPNIPFNVTQLLQAVSGIQTEEESAAKANKEIQEKILNDPKLYKEALGRWLNIMNKIAFNDRKSFDANPFKITTG